MSHEQSLHLGEREWELKDPVQELSPLVEEVAATRRKADELARDLTMDTLGMHRNDDPIYERFKSLAHTMTEAPFAKYSETFVGLMSNKDNSKVADANQQLRSLENQIVVDVGNGRNPRLLQEFLAQYGVKAYLGIDTHNLFDQEHTVSRLDDFGDVMYLDKSVGDYVDGALVRGDMLRVVSRLPDNSASLAFCGIDTYIVNPSTPYGTRLVEECVRVLSPQGLVFGIQGVAVKNGILNVLEARPDFESVGPEFPGLIFLKKKI